MTDWVRYDNWAYRITIKIFEYLIILDPPYVIIEKNIVIIWRDLRKMFIFVVIIFAIGAMVFVNVKKRRLLRENLKGSWYFKNSGERAFIVMEGRNFPLVASFIDSHFYDYKEAIIEISKYSITFRAITSVYATPQIWDVKLFGNEIHFRNYIPGMLSTWTVVVKKIIGATYTQEALARVNICTTHNAILTKNRQH